MSSNPVMDVLEQSQGGQLIAAFGVPNGLSPDQSRQVLKRLTPEIARRIAERIDDDEAYEDLIEILDEDEQVASLDHPQRMFSRQAVEDGEDMLELLYGSIDAARKKAGDIGAPDGVDRGDFGRLMTIAATLTFAAMARRNQQFHLTSGGEDARTEAPAGGFISVIISALITGFMQGFRQATRRRRTRRRRRSVLERILGTGETRRRRRKSKRRRTSSRRRRRTRRRKTPSLTDLLGDLLD